MHRTPSVVPARGSLAILITISCGLILAACGGQVVSTVFQDVGEEVPEPVADTSGPPTSLKPFTEDTGQPSESRSTFRTHQDTQVIVGSDKDHVIVTQPLVEVLPLIGGDPAALRLAFGPVGMLGIEGAIGFVSAHASDGTVVLDRIVSFEGDSVEMLAGAYTVRVYYRACDGSCALLDPAQDFCTIEHSFVAGEEFDVTVTDDGRRTGNCSH